MSESEQAPAFDFFSQCARMIDQVCEFQQTLANDVFDRLERVDETPETAVETTTECCRNLYNGVASNPAAVVAQSVELWQRQLQLCHNVLLKVLGDTEIEPLVRPRIGDRRFIDDAWQENLLFDFIKQSYLITAEHCMNSVEQLEGIEARSRDRLLYYTRQLVNALAPTNFPLTNPEVLRKTLDTKGENLLQGLQMMVEDKKRSADILNICTSNPTGFELGRNLACTPGRVVAQNDLMQLIQYEPVTAEVQRTPVLIVPSWVNKYYILDLSAENSYVRWLVEQGHTVFLISWINPDTSHREVGFGDYLRHGPLAALDDIERITGERRVSAVGYCLGGILLACTLAYTDGAGEGRFASATYLAASLDFSDAGDMGLFVDEAMVEAIERTMAPTGYFDGRLLAAGFSLLRENDLYWNYYVMNYLKGERPAAFDLMHWNSDSTNVPAATHRFIMRELHLRNGLVNGAVELAGRSIDLRRITTPTYVLATDKDHIAHWRSCYAASQLQAGEVRFVLAGSGHIAGVINPPRADKYYHYLNPERPADPDVWLDRAFKREGSWWSDWAGWQAHYSGDRVPARAVDLSLEAAPGCYAMRRLDTWLGARAAA